MWFPLTAVHAGLHALMRAQGARPRTLRAGGRGLHAYDKPEAQTTNLVSDLKRLFKHKAIYPAIMINFMWNFAPGGAHDTLP